MADIQNIRREVASLLTPLLDLRPVMPAIRNLLLRSIQLNFRVGGRIGSGDLGGGSDKWIPSKDAKEEGRQTLIDSGDLYASITAKVEGQSIVITSDKVYAATQQYGDPSRGIAEHPFVVIQDEDVQAVRDLVGDYYGSLIG